MINLDTISAILILQELKKKALRDIVDFANATHAQYENCICFDRNNPIEMPLQPGEHAYGVVLGAVIDESHHDCYSHYDRNIFDGLVYVIETDDGELMLRANLYSDYEMLELAFDDGQWHEL